MSLQNYYSTWYLHVFACICHIYCWLQWWMLLHKFPSDVLKFHLLANALTEVPNPLAAKLCVVNSQRGARREMKYVRKCNHILQLPSVTTCSGLILSAWFCLFSLLNLGHSFSLDVVKFFGRFHFFCHFQSLSFDLSAHRTAASGRVMASAAKCCSASCETCENTRGPKSRVWDTRRDTRGISG